LETEEALNENAWKPKTKSNNFVREPRKIVRDFDNFEYDQEDED